jgi:uncharacterized protein YndB with AHSA1/START domain
MATHTEGDHVAHATTTIAASADRVWDALTNPATIKQYMFGATVTSTWRVGDAITWKGEMKGKTYEDRGRILRSEPNRLIEYTHFSPMSGQPDAPENHHVVTVTLSPATNGTRVDLAQTKNPTDDARRHSEENWNQMLAGLKRAVEGSSS